MLRRVVHVKAFQRGNGNALLGTIGENVWPYHFPIEFEIGVMTGGDEEFLW